MIPGQTGTKFRLYPQLPSLESNSESEIVYVSPPAGSLQPGPSDDRMYVIDPIGKERPYGFYDGPFNTQVHYRPPWNGPVRPPAEADNEGHFDHLEPGTPQFEQAHVYGTVRFTLDIWEDYFGHEIDWHFGDTYDNLEILFLRGLDNAYAGFGSIEVGSYQDKGGTFVELGLSFDVVSHEVGHLIIYSEVGLPATDNLDGEYFGFHESAADMVSLISLMHFDSALIGLLEASHGNLYSYNRLNRFGEVSEFDQLRLASNAATLYDFADGWDSEHELSQPMTGALFDIWVDVFHENLLNRGLISPDVEDLADQLEDNPQYHDILQPIFDEAYAREPEGFARAMADSRDYMGSALANVWSDLSKESLDYGDVFEAFLEADQAINAGEYRSIITNNMLRRGIGQVEVGPRLRPPASDSHAFSPRTAKPDTDQHTHCRHIPFSLRVARARG